MDRSHSRSQQAMIPKKIANKIKAKSLVDKWRVKNEDRQDYTRFSSIYNSFPCVDYIFLSEAMLPSIDKAEIGLHIFAAYTPVTTVWSSSEKSNVCRVNIYSLGNQRLVTTVVKQNIYFWKCIRKSRIRHSCGKPSKHISLEDFD